MNALADLQVGKFINEHFVSSFQKVGTFRIVGQQKQGGNVAAYFCAPDGRVLHVVAGPVDGATMLAESKWIVGVVRRALREHEQTGGSFKALVRQAHADRLRERYGVTVQPVLFDAPVTGEQGAALSYRDPSGRPLAPVLRPPPIEGPDVQLRLDAARAAGASDEVALQCCRCLSGPQLAQIQVHQLLAAHALKKIEVLYASVFEGILGEKVSTEPVQVVSPFPWVSRR